MKLDVQLHVGKASTEPNPSSIAGPASARVKLCVADFFFLGNNLAVETVRLQLAVLQKIKQNGVRKSIEGSRLELSNVLWQAVCRSGGQRMNYIALGVFVQLRSFIFVKTTKYGFLSFPLGSCLTGVTRGNGYCSIERYIYFDVRKKGRQGTA